jgi:hypothetical protein
MIAAALMQFYSVIQMGRGFNKLSEPNFKSIKNNIMNKLSLKDPSVMGSKEAEALHSPSTQSACFAGSANSNPDHGLLSSCKIRSPWPKNKLISPVTEQQLNSAREATTKYRTFKTPSPMDTRILMVRQNMGFHYLKASLLDTIFDATKPEILVYNKCTTGIPLWWLGICNAHQPASQFRPKDLPAAPMFGNMIPNSVYGYCMPGFGNTIPDGVFNPTNPSVHLH